MQPGTDAESADAILAAATKVFTSEATRQVTLKRVALEARVPSHVVTAQWASPAELLSEVFGRLGEDLSRTCPPGQVPRHGGEVDAEQGELIDAMLQILVRSALDGMDLTERVDHYPTIERLVRQHVDEGLDELTARYRVFQAVLVEFGFRIFADQLQIACGLTDEPVDRLRDEVNALEQMVTSLPPVPSEV